MKRNSQNVVVVVVGVAGSGKSTVGRLLASELSCPFSDADDFHNPANKQKMSAGVPLSDEDRKPWLAAMRAAITTWLSEGQSHVLACSALKGSYRQHLQGADPRVRFVYLKASPEVVEARLRARSNHFMKANMVSSQFEALEEPAADEAICLSASEPVETIVKSVCRHLGLLAP